MVFQATFAIELTFVWARSIIGITMLGNSIIGSGSASRLGGSSSVAHRAVAPHFVSPARSDRFLPFSWGL
jgi:hypothetical protein